MSIHPIKACKWRGVIDCDKTRYTCKPKSIEAVLKNDGFCRILDPYQNHIPHSKSLLEKNSCELRMCQFYCEIGTYHSSSVGSSVEFVAFMLGKTSNGSVQLTKICQTAGAVAMTSNGAVGIQHVLDLTKKQQLEKILNYGTL